MFFFEDRRLLPRLGLPSWRPRNQYIAFYEKKHTLFSTVD
jgi:hypothetical protein